MAFGNTSIEWDEDVDLLVERLEEESEERDLTREERAIIDVVETVQLLQEGDGLHDFWQSSVTHSRIVNSFDLVGASGVVDVLNASQWCQTRPEDRAQYSETESDYLSEIESDLNEALGDINELICEFIEDELE
mgnify:CR=1 FL=1